MKIIVIFLVLNCYFNALYCSNIDGIYHDESGLTLTIEKDSFKLKLPITDNLFWSKILAEGTVSIVDNSFIELNTPSPCLRMYLNTKVVQEKRYDNDNKTIMHFVIPYKYDSLEIAIYVNHSKTYILSYSEHNQTIEIPENVKEFSFNIRPYYIFPYGKCGSSNGIVCYDSMPYEVTSGTNFIEVDMPTMDNSYFQKYYINGEYARVLGNKIIWKGRTFIKQR